MLKSDGKRGVMAKLKWLVNFKVSEATKVEATAAQRNNEKGEE